MGENHLTYFKIENFKRFDSFEMENLGQFNLLVGDNNVGKTSVLEALLFDIKTNEWLVRLYTSLTKRRILPQLSKDFYLEIAKVISTREYWYNLQNNIGNQTVITFNKKKYLELNSIGILPIQSNETTQFDKKNIQINSLLEYGQANGQIVRVFKNKEQIDTVVADVNYLSLSQKQFILLANNERYGQELVKKYSSFINSDKLIRKTFDESLRLLIPKLEETRLHNSFGVDGIGVVLIDENIVYPLTRFGDGALKIARIIIGILIGNDDNRLMVDEIETGIHFSRLTDFWKMVITLCKQYDVQLFATTHSLECQRYFIEALSELGEDYQNDARNISLVEDASGEVKSVTFDFNQFEFALSIGANTRGGQR